MICRLIIILTILLFPVLGKACGCSGAYDYSQANSDFIGRVSKIKRIDDTTIRYEITFKVKWVIKGEDLITKRTIITTHSLMEGACGVDFKIGKKYRIFTIEDNKTKLYTSYCQMNYQIDSYRKSFRKGFKKPI